MPKIEQKHREEVRQHDMSFGAKLNSDGSFSFNFWAPSSQQVELCLFNESAQSAHLIKMTKEGEWFRLQTTEAKVGMEYAYRIDGDTTVPDPASRYQKTDVHGHSVLIDPTVFKWSDSDWRGRPWKEAVIYELHVGTFSKSGNFKGVIEKLDYLNGLGITAVELMPIADFPGNRGWGYDGVLPYAPETTYGTPEELKELVQEAHKRGLMIFLDVVYNHFGPEGNYLHVYAKKFFTEKHKTPWGAAIDFEEHQAVRDFFIENALYWLEEYNFDGLRLDAVHAIKDNSKKHILEELAERVKSGPGKIRDRHLVLENDDNAARFLKRDQDGSPTFYTAQWNDDIHHAYHVIATEEKGGYYEDYVKNDKFKSTAELLNRALAEGFIYQGDPSAYRDGEVRGEKSAHLPPTAFVSFLQNHDQIGNRAFGDRIAAIAKAPQLRALTAVQLLAPAIPLIFMGEEWGTTTPFFYFCDLGAELAPLVTEGRRNEFAKFPEFSDPKVRESIPDPCQPETFDKSKLDWTNLDEQTHKEWLEHYRKLLNIRLQKLAPLFDGLTVSRAGVSDNVIEISWKKADQIVLALLANLSDSTTSYKAANHNLNLLYATSGHEDEAVQASGSMPPWSVFWFTA